MKYLDQILDSYLESMTSYNENLRVLMKVEFGFFIGEYVIFVLIGLYFLVKYESNQLHRTKKVFLLLPNRILSTNQFVKNFFQRELEYKY